MKISSIGIAGLGLIGGSIAKSLRLEYPELKISAFDFPSVLEKAKQQNVIDESVDDHLELLDDDLIILSLPVFKSLSLFEELYPKLSKHQIIVDVCSVKSLFFESSKRISSKGKYIGLHPMAGKEKNGFDFSDSLLFENAVCFVCDNDNNEITEYVLNFLKCTGLRFTFIDAFLHDKIAAEVSHLPQLLSVALVNEVAKVENNFNFINFAGSGFRDMTRIASSDFKLWEEIIKANKQNIITSLKNIVQRINSISENLASDNFDYLKEQFELANKNRNEIPFNNKGFIQPLFDITVFLEDKAGTLNKLTSVLAKHNLNIKDIELLKIREGSGGNFRLYFDSAESAQRANQILKENNFATNITN
ncbi:prephenate dehydrogenase/arogenate dehydrogenase family protein [Ignavibacterium sp.]|uniref:prephenate dehydrogenase/arogenate dehydrogenase family protein n=1 Tax=Ignavibacterium sp. TaxID=2651167 RepID=UPI0021F98376|nr:prephenate dehydrogenase/arogenate dehydrogenase family protein [Ignavibacterium sp.]BDQ01928.1 MAG: prephenate dehydrogenase [Ignavibacterium sp.]